MKSDINPRGKRLPTLLEKLLLGLTKNMADANGPTQRKKDATSQGRLTFRRHCQQCISLYRVNNLIMKIRLINDLCSTQCNE